eukprot:8418794-Lingulodinium_polyedra.AAC.1
MAVAMVMAMVVVMVVVAMVMEMVTTDGDGNGRRFLFPHEIHAALSTTLPVTPNKLLGADCSHGRPRPGSAASGRNRLA